MKNTRYGWIRQDCLHDIYQKRHPVSKNSLFYYMEVNIKIYGKIKQRIADFGAFREEAKEIEITCNTIQTSTSLCNPGYPMNVYNNVSSDKKQKNGKKTRYGWIRQDCLHDIYQE